MKGYWIAIEEGYGATNDNNDYYLFVVREWWSKTGNEWEEQPERVEIWSDGSADRYRYSSLDAAADDIEQYDKEASDYIRDGAPNADQTYTAVCWAVDDAGIQRGCYPEEFTGFDSDLIGLIEKLDGEIEDEKSLKEAVLRQGRTGEKQP